MQVDRVEVQVVGPEVQRYTWSHDLPEQYMTNTIVRVNTNDGAEGFGAVTNYTSYDFDKYTAETLKHLIPILIGRNPLKRQQIWDDLWPRVFPIAPSALAVIDIALWDLAAKISNIPLYQMLGGARDRIPSYASTPMLPNIDAYLKFVEHRIDEGFRAIKFHQWCVPDKDLELAKAIREAYPENDIVFMLDAENNYQLEDAIAVAKELQDLGFNWFEAPLPDYDLEGYKSIQSSAKIPIIPSGNWFQDLASFTRAVKSSAWSAARADVTILGGITPLSKAMDIAINSDMNLEVLGWGHSLVSAANLHVMLAFNNCTYYEQPTPYKAYEYGMLDVIRTQSDGHVYAPKGPGLGLEVDWKAMESSTIYKATYA